MPTEAIVRVPRDTAANWSSINPVPKLGELALETDTKLLKPGDGVSSYASLPYITVRYIDILSKPTTLAGYGITDAQPQDVELDALSGVSSTGLLARTGPGTAAARTLTAPAAGLTISNPAGVAGNPTFALADDLAALEALTGTSTIYYRSAANTWTAVAIGGNLGFVGGTLGSSLGTMATQAASAVAITGGTVQGISYFGSFASGSAADNRRWDIIPSGFTILFRAINDAGSVAGTYMQVTRSGTTISEVSFPGAAVVVAGTLRPATDNAVALGSASFRWSQLYAGTATINTSDEREKGLIGEIPDAWLDAWGEVRWCRFKFREAVAEKGDGARWHLGLVAQQVRDAFAGRGLDALEIGLLCHDEWPDLCEPMMREVDRVDTCRVLELIDRPASGPGSCSDRYRWVERPVMESVPVAAGKDAAGNPIYRMVARQKTVPTVEPTGETRVVRAAGDLWGLRYGECMAIEAAWVRREIERLRTPAAN